MVSAGLGVLSAHSLLGEPGFPAPAWLSNISDGTPRGMFDFQNRRCHFDPVHLSGSRCLDSPTPSTPDRRLCTLPHHRPRPASALVETGGTRLPHRLPPGRAPIGPTLSPRPQAVIPVWD